ncbi:aldo/keto reductase [Clostridium magnum]|uniref:General stress protein 69 n=1 Tax=Clostridium magnum DSM 2767 TaxID=1121326 RepID=A0A161X1H0_9CLOT|nr:aldo/keto reductase [Clostridium magnum]KZL93298.1 general stress protein 69 [Clostridium magnum DSM 2767]SHJ51548.1 Predicted oxidoreductase of the aldo/keto reductase family [Clostridium magnum DSM 2767]
MNYKELGSTGLKVSVIGFGGIPIQRIDDKDAKKVITSAEEKGINFIDTARGYSISEEYIGKALEGRREKWIIATKSMSRDRESMKKDVKISLSNLKTDYIDLYQFHNIKTMEEYNKVLSEDGAYNALVQYKNEGKIRHIGITSHSLDILKIAIESGKFETIMYPYNIVENQAEELFKRAKELNIGVIAMKPMAGGALIDGTLALKYILQNENVTCAIPGMGTIEEVEENSNLGSNMSVLNEEEKAKVKKISEELGTEFCRRCGYCAPCSKGIDIPSVFLFQGYKERYNLEQWAEERYAAMKHKAEECIECGVCEERCPYNLPIRSMLKNAEKIFGK